MENLFFVIPHCKPSSLGSDFPVENPIWWNGWKMWQLILFHNRGVYHGDFVEKSADLLPTLGIFKFFGEGIKERFKAQS